MKLNKVRITYFLYMENINEIILEILLGFLIFSLLYIDDVEHSLEVAVFERTFKSVL